VAAIASISALVFYYRQDAILLYGDAVAHINIARRVFDSRWPGPGQLGTVWLPLPHILILPFVISKAAWQSGLGGSIPSMVAYVAAVVGVYRLVRRGLVSIGAHLGRARLAAIFGAVVLGANPNLLYMQSTAMNEPLFIAFVIWATVYLASFARAMRSSAVQTEDARHAGRSLRLCGVMLMCAMLCRYDGWFMAAWFGVAALGIIVRGGPLVNQSAYGAGVRKAFFAFVVLLAIAPSFWLAWNKFYFDNALEWMNGPYSAQAIMERSMRRGQPPHPGYQDVKTATVYYVKCAKLNLAGNNLGWGGARYGWPKRIEDAWPVLAVAGTVALLVFAPALWPLLLLWVPLLFYALSIAYGGVPIFMPVWWPFSYYNVRYGLQVLPAVAVFGAIAVYFISSVTGRKSVAVLVALAAFGFVGVSYRSVWRSGPVCLHEARENSRVRIGLEHRVGDALKRLPPESTMLMQIGYYVGVLQRAGIPLKRTINESDYVVWYGALADPANRVHYLVAADDDDVARTARRHAGDFKQILTFEAPGQPTVTIYGKK
jgi:hypothetical protein